MCLLIKAMGFPIEEVGTQAKLKGVKTALVWIPNSFICKGFEFILFIIYCVVILSQKFFANIYSVKTQKIVLKNY